MDYHPIQGGVEILLVTSCFKNRDKLWPDGPLPLDQDFNFLPYNFVCTTNNLVFITTCYLPQSKW